MGVALATKHFVVKKWAYHAHCKAYRDRLVYSVTVIITFKSFITIICMRCYICVFSDKSLLT